MDEKMLNHVLNHFLAKFKNVQSDQSPGLLEKLTLSQYKNLAQIDVQTSANLSAKLESYLSDHLEILNLEIQLKRKKCALAGKLNRLNTQLNEAIEQTNKRNIQLKAGDIDFLNPKSVPVEPTKHFVKPSEPKKQIPLVEPNYSTRVIRETVAQQSVSLMDSIMKPPTFSSLAMSTKKEKKENVPKPQIDSFNLDDSLLNGHEISMVNISDERRRLEFDELDDDDEKEKTPVRPKMKTQKTPARVPVTSERKPLDLYSLPPPPVFTSSSGRVFNLNRD